MQNPISMITCALIVVLSVTDAAQADQNLNCDAYAAAAVAHQQQNNRLGCGYSGGAWSMDYDGHRNWCLQRDVAMADLTGEDGGRAGALEICAAKAEACDSYATLAVLQNRHNQTSTCGLSGGGWSGDAAGHRNWCMGASPEANIGETEARTAALQSCLNQLGEDAQLANVDLQNALQRQQQVTQMMSNISKTLHDTSMAIIRKIGG